VLLLAQEAGVLKVGTISLDGTKLHADASRHHAVSYQRLLELETQLRAEVEELDQRDIPDGLVVREEIARREDRLARLAKAKAVLEVRAQERAAAEQAAYSAKMAQRAERERTTGRREGWPSTESTCARTPRQRPVQLHRPGVTRHEKSDRRGL
jgi:hypothetical protein